MSPEASSASSAGKRGPAIEVVDLHRDFRKGRNGATVKALAGVSLRVEEGEVHGLLGPNGAGKTTLVKVLSTLLLPTAGRASVLGYDVVEEAPRVRSLIGLVFGGERGLYPRLTARQNLHYFGSLYGLDGSQVAGRCEEVLERLGLATRAGDRVESFSRGMKQRLHLARGLIGGQPVLFLDEPTIGLDPVAAHEFRRLIQELTKEGKTILLATHDMTEAETLCSRVSLIDRGRHLATETPAALGSLVGRRPPRVLAEGMSEALVQELTELEGVASLSLEGDKTEITLDDAALLPTVLQKLASGGVVSLRAMPPTLEDIYLELIGERGLEV